MKRIVFFAIVLAIFVGIWLHFQKMSCKVVGLSTALGPIQSTLEAPFFSDTPKRSDSSLTCQYVPQNMQGVTQNSLIKYLQQGFYDMAAITFRQSEGIDIAIAGMDLPGLPADLNSSRMLSKDFLSFLNEIFEEKFKSKIITTFSFGPLELFCAKPVKNLADLQGLKIRITTQQGSSISKLLITLGAKPISIDYGSALNAIQDKVIDCGISSYASAESAGWLKYLPYRMDLNMGNTISAYVINLKTWNALNSRQKIALKNSLTDLSDSMWDFSEKTNAQSLLPCSSNDFRCLERPKSITFNQKDLDRINQISVDSILKPWLKNCDEMYFGCKSAWLNAAKTNLRLQNLNLSDL